MLWTRKFAKQLIGERRRKKEEQPDYFSKQDGKAEFLERNIPNIC
jgi:hypothetical protein